MSTLTTFVKSGPPPVLVENEHGKMIKGLLKQAADDKARWAPRSQQVRIGPSEIGDPCLRKLAYKLSRYPELSEDDGHWYATIGTSVHAWLEKALGEQNRRNGSPIWLIEHKVPVTDHLRGTCDAFHIPSGTATDHKVVGKTSYDEYRQHGMREQYRIQAHCYGQGMANLGYEVNHVAVALYPRFAQLDRMFVWSEPFDPSVVTAAIERLQSIQDVIELTSFPANPELYTHVPRYVSNACAYCPWRKPGPDNGDGCPGNLAL